MPALAEDIRRRARMALILRARTTDVNPSARSVSVEKAAWWSQQLGVPVPAGTPTAALPSTRSTKQIADIKALPPEQRTRYLEARKASVDGKRATHAEALQIASGRPAKAAKAPAKKAPARAAPRVSAAERRAEAELRELRAEQRMSSTPSRLNGRIMAAEQKLEDARAAKKATPAKAAKATPAKATPAPVALSGSQQRRLSALSEGNWRELRNLTDAPGDISTLEGLRRLGLVEISAGRARITDRGREALDATRPAKATAPAAPAKATPAAPVPNSPEGMVRLTEGLRGTAERYGIDTSAVTPRKATPAKAAPRRLTALETVRVSPEELTQAAREGRISRPAAARQLRKRAELAEITVATAGDSPLPESRARAERAREEAARLRALADEIEARPAKATPPAKAATPAKKATPRKAAPAPTRTPKQVLDQLHADLRRLAGSDDFQAQSMSDTLRMEARDFGDGRTDLDGALFTLGRMAGRAENPATADMLREAIGNLEQIRDSPDYRDRTAIRRQFADRLSDVDRRSADQIRAALAQAEDGRISWGEAASRLRGYAGLLRERGPERLQGAGFHHRRESLRAAELIDDVVAAIDGRGSAPAMPAKKATPRKATRPTAPEGMVRKPFPESATTPAARVAHLRSIDTREQAQDAIADLKRKDLVDIARELSVPGTGSLTVDQLRAEVVQAAVGRRLNSIATRGFTGDRPDQPGETAQEFFARTRREAGLPPTTGPTATTASGDDEVVNDFGQTAAEVRQAMRDQQLAAQARRDAADDRIMGRRPIATTAAPDPTGSGGLSSDPAVREVQIDSRLRAAIGRLRSTPYKHIGRLNPNIELRDSGDYVYIPELREELGLGEAEFLAAIRRLNRQPGVAVYDQSERRNLIPQEHQPLRFGGQDTYWLAFDSRADLSPRPLPEDGSTSVTDLSDYRRALDNGLSPRDAASYAAWVRNNPGGSIAAWQASRRERAQAATFDPDEVADSLQQHVDRFTALTSASLRAREVQAEGEAGIRQALSGLNLGQLRRVASRYRFGQRPPTGVSASEFLDWMLAQWRNERGRFSLQ